MGVPGSAVAKNPPANTGDRRDTGSTLGWEDPLEWKMAIHSDILAWKIPWTEELGGLSPQYRKESDMTEQLLLFHS